MSDPEDNVLDANAAGSDRGMMTSAEFDPKRSPEFKRKLDRLYHLCYIRLGGSSIRVDLNDEDYRAAFENAVNFYRRARSRSITPMWGWLSLEPIKQVYQLNERIDLVKRMYRSRGLFGGIGAGIGRFERFGAATANILLRGGFNPQAATVDLVSYDFMMQYQQTLDRLFARELNFIWRQETHELIVGQVPRVREVVGLDLSLLKSYNELLDDRSAYDWLLRYTLAELKCILGEKYTLFGGHLPGPQGGTTLKGDRLIRNGNEEKKTLEMEVWQYADNGDIPMPVRG